MSGPTLRRVSSFSSIDQKFFAVLQAFGGRTEISVWAREKSQGQKGPVIKLLFTSASLFIFKKLLNKCIEDENASPSELSFFPWRAETKTNEFRGAMTIGRDKEQVIYIEIRGDRHKESIRFSISQTRDIRLNDKEIPEKQASEIAAGTLIDLIDNVLQFGSFFTINEAPVEPTTASPSQTSSTSVGDDVPF